MWVKFLPELCEFFWQIIEAEEGLMGIPDLEPVGQKYR